MCCLLLGRDAHRFRDRQTFGVHLQQRCFHEVMGGSEGADRIGGGGVSRKQKRLAAAAAEVLGAAVATAAGLWHPFFTTKSAERVGFLPDPSKSTFAYVLEFESWDHTSGMAGKRFAGGIDQHKALAPSTHAGFRIFRVVVGDD